MKMLIKILKNPNAKLHSDIKEKGKGKRLKRPSKHFDESYKENQPVKKRRRHVHQSMLPPLPSIPKITSMCNLSQANQLLSDKMDKVITYKSKCTDEVRSSLDNSQQELLSSYVNETPSTSYMAFKKRKVSEEDSSLTGRHQSTSSSSKCHSGKMSSSGCKIQSKENHNCCYTSEGTVTLESLADAICHLSGMLQL